MSLRSLIAREVWLLPRHDRMKEAGDFDSRLLHTNSSKVARAFAFECVVLGVVLHFPAHTGMMADGDAQVTLSLLDERLHRLEYLLSGLTDHSGLPEPTPKPSPDLTVAARLSKLEEDLSKLTSRSTLAQDVLKLQRRHPDLFHADDSHETKSADISTIASIVLAHTAQFPETASRLSSLQTLPVPEAVTSSQLLDVKPRVDRAMEAQRAQELEVAQLRERSARLMEWWVNVGVVGMGECWADWEARVRDCGRVVAIMEARQARDAS